MLNIEAILESNRWKYPYLTQKNFVVPAGQIVGFYIKCKDVSVLKDMVKPLKPEEAKDEGLASKISQYTKLAFNEPKPSAMAIKMAEWNMNKSEVPSFEARKITFINGFVATNDVYFNPKVRGFNGLVFVVKTNTAIDTGTTGTLIAKHMNYVGKAGLLSKLLSEIWKIALGIIGVFMMDWNYEYIDKFSYRGAVRLGSVEDFSIEESSEQGEGGKEEGVVKAGFTLDNAMPLIILFIMGGLIWKMSS